MKKLKIKKGDLMPWFLEDHGQLPQWYLEDTEKFFKWFEKKTSKLQASSRKLQASSSKLGGAGELARASSLKKNSTCSCIVYYIYHHPQPPANFK